jgi:hypothetical protein
MPARGRKLAIVAGNRNIERALLLLDFGVRACDAFQIRTIECWLDRTPETAEDHAIREEGESIRKAFPWVDFDHPGARKVRPPKDI